MSLQLPFEFLRPVRRTLWGMNSKPSYLGLLNAISLAETEAEGYLNCWAATTKSDDVRAIIASVAIREGEHGKAFAKRISELGFAVVPRGDSDEADAKMAIASSTEMSDCEKFEKLKVGRQSEPGTKDIFSSFFDDTSMDIQTGALMGRYVAEERDSGRMLATCYQQLQAANQSHAASSPALEGLAGQLGRIESLLEKLVSAQC